MTAIKAVAVAAVVIVLTAPSPPPLLAQLDDDFVADTEKYLSGLEKLGFAGSVMITVGERVLLARGYGDANRNPSVPWTTGTVSTIGSITKQFTAAAIMKLQEDGKLSVDDTLDKHFENVPSDKSAITLHQLLSHSSGITDPPVDDFTANTRDEYVRIVFGTELNAAPGTHYEYANANFSLLGAIIERVTGKNYEEAMHALVFQPVGLTMTGYTMPDYHDAVVADAYVDDERWGTILERPMADDGPYWALRANGGIHSTAEEMVKWGRVLLDNTLLTRASRDAMWSRHIDESNNGVGESFYGYGWVVFEQAPGVDVVTHNGGNGFLFADMMIVPSEDLVAIVQTNVISTFGETNNVLQRFLERSSGEPYPALPAVVDMNLRQLEKWAGTYTLDGGDEFEVAADGNALRVTPKGWGAYAVVHSLPEQDTAPLLRMSADIERIVGAFMNGNFEPLHDAYQGRVSVERLKTMYQQRLAEREAQYGTPQGFEVLGTGTGAEYHFTLVRYRYERERVLRTYVWSREEAGNLLGVTTRHMDPVCKLFPVEGGSFESWNPSTGASVKATLVTDGSSARFVVERRSGAVVASR